MTRGYTLLELATVLTVVGLSLASLAPAARAYRDRASVHGARETVAGVLAEARLRAPAVGGASVRLFGPPWRVALLVRDSVVRVESFGIDFGVVVAAVGPDTIDVTYDALGFGRVSSQTLVFARGDARADLVVSAYGRVRRR